MRFPQRDATNSASSRRKISHSPSVARRYSYSPRKRRRIVNSGGYPEKTCQSVSLRGVRRRQNRCIDTPTPLGRKKLSYALSRRAFSQLVNDLDNSSARGLDKHDMVICVDVPILGYASSPIAGTASSSTSAGSVAPIVTRSFIVVGFTFCCIIA